MKVIIQVSFQNHNSYIFKYNFLSSKDVLKNTYFLHKKNQCHKKNPRKNDKVNKKRSFLF